MSGTAPGPQRSTSTSLLKDTVKGTNSRRRQDGAGSGKVPSTGTSVPVKLGCITLPVCGRTRHPENAPKPILGALSGGCPGSEHSGEPCPGQPSLARE